MLPPDFSFCYCILKIYRSLSLSLFATPSLGHKGRRYNLKSSPSEGRHSVAQHRFWTAPFLLNCTKNSRNASAFREFYCLVIKKVATSKLHSTWKGWSFLSGKAKSTEILCVFRAFLTQHDGNKHFFQAMLHYGVSPKGELLLYYWLQIAI